MPLLSTFGAAPAKAFGFTSGGKEAPGSWFAPEGENAADSYQPIGYAAVTVTVVGVCGGSGYGGNNQRWQQNNAAFNTLNKIGTASKVVKNDVDPTTLKFRTIETSATADLGLQSGADELQYSGSRANLANQGAFTGAPGGGASVAFTGNAASDNNAIIVAAGGGATGRPDRNSQSAYFARTDADESANNTVSGKNNGSSASGSACYYTAGGSGGGAEGGAAANQNSNRGGYSGNSHYTGATLTTGIKDTAVGENNNQGFAKIDWS